MKLQSVRNLGRVSLLTLLCLFALCSCAYVNRTVNDRYADYCKNHAYIAGSVKDYLTNRYGSGSQARLAIVPFVSPANLAGNAERGGVGYEMAQMVHQQILPMGVMPIVEVMNRRDWPGKRDEFFSGDFGAIQAARDAGYDMVLVGLIEEQKSPDMLVVNTKLIETESRMTLWYGKSEVMTSRPDIHKASWYFWLDERTPSLNYYAPLMREGAKCIARGIFPKDER